MGGLDSPPHSPSQQEAFCHALTFPGCMVINVFDLFLLSCLGRLSFTWKGLSVRERLLAWSSLGSGRYRGPLGNLLSA